MPADLTWTTDGPIHVASSPGGLWLMVDEPPPSAGDPCIWQVRIGNAAGPLLAHGTKRDAEQARGEAEASAAVALEWAETRVAADRADADAARRRKEGRD